jgi:hypothetical protein
MEGYGGAGGSYLDRLQGRDDNTAATPPPGGMASPPPPRQPPAPTGPSDYTRVIRGSAAPTPGDRSGDEAPSPYGAPRLPQPSKGSSASPTAPAPAASRTPLVVALVVTVAVIVALVLFFALRGGGSAG